MTPPSRKHALEAELREIKRFEKEDRAANPKVKGEPGSATVRASVSPSRRMRLWLGGHCHCARCWMQVLTSAPIDHILPLELGGSDTDDNMQFLCVECHKNKTREDIARISKARRQAKMMQPKEPSKRPLQSRNTFR